MRDIKFRAWDGEEMYNDVHHVGDKVFDPNGGFWREYKEAMQYTGLKDKNGKEIYEGDLVKTNYGKIGSIVYHEERAAFIIHDSNHFNELLYHEYYTEVIGNIYENPELLTESTERQP